jgi:site-specific DNA-methyltransferase (adenine-specific)
MSLYYQDDYVTLYHGDCLTEHREWLDADVLVTDPPYGIDYAQHTMHKAVKAKKSVVAGDKTTEARDRMLAAWGARPSIVFGSWRMPLTKSVRQRLIWHKVQAKPGMSTAPWFSADEEIYVIGDGFTGKPEQTVIRTMEARSGSDGLSAQVGHPTPKPVPLMEMLIKKCPPGVIADPFAGSGSTLVAAKNLGRKVIGVELEERYCEIIAKRCAQDVLDIFGVAS